LYNIVYIAHWTFDYTTPVTVLCVSSI